ncbi:hypothetical protein, partial [Campylobacter jejuni]
SKEQGYVQDFSFTKEGVKSWRI